MRSPAPGQRLQVTGGILTFAILSRPIRQIVAVACATEKLNSLRHAGFHTFGPFAFGTARACTHQTAESQQSCSPGVQTPPPTPSQPRTATV